MDFTDLGPAMQQSAVNADPRKLQRAVDGLQRDVIGLTKIMQRVVERLEQLERGAALGRASALELWIVLFVG